MNELDLGSPDQLLELIHQWLEEDNEQLRQAFVAGCEYWGRDVLNDDFDDDDRRQAWSQARARWPTVEVGGG